MLVSVLMPLALLGAQVAGHAASIDLGGQQVLGRMRLTREYIFQCTADIGAIQIQADAPGHMLHHLLAQAGVGAGGA